jgi:hypothetical protein
MKARPTLAIVTPSYAADFERCELLCESLDAFAVDAFRHYIVVADHDHRQFAALSSPRREVIPDSELLPVWLKAVRRPFDRLGRHVWISGDIRKQIRPLSGWHVQQLRKLALPRMIDQDVIVMADSDSMFVRPFGVSNFKVDDEVRLYRRHGVIGVDPQNEADHVAWTRNAASALGLPEPSFPADDYINNLVSWRRDRALALVARIEALSGMQFVQALGRLGAFSEYQLYGAFASGPAAMSGHFASADALSHTYWNGGALDRDGMRAFVDQLQPHQIALCVQSFTRTPVELMRGLFKASADAAVHT